MVKKAGRSATVQPPAGLPPKDFRALAQGIFQYANSGVSRVDFLREIARMLLEFAGCDAIELRVKKKDQCFRCEATHCAAEPFRMEVTRCEHEGENALLACGPEGSPVEVLCRMIVQGRAACSSPCFTPGGSFWTGNLKDALPHALGRDAAAGREVSGAPGRYLSLVIIPLITAEETIGLLQLKSERKDCFREADVERYEGVAQTLGLALASRLAHASLRERIKELTCLYSLAQLAGRPGIELEEVFQGIAELLPPAWQYPEITVARVIFDGRCYATADFRQCVQKQSAELVVNGRQRGSIEVGYTRETAEYDEGPFLKEERSLIDTVARQIAVLVERRQAAEEKRRLQDQLRHADRLATIGQLSAGVAHELNEPLGNILAFAQLAGKEPGVPDQAARDLERIVTTSLHAREVIKKLMLFARQMPPQKTAVDLNTVVEEGLYFLESRCSKSGVRVERCLSPGLPEVVADPSQLNQVLVNLVVNAIQAMPGGGTLRIATGASEKQVLLSVEDNGSGMSEEVLKRVFIPFFTTKDVHEGTGLGLPVVHGIVNSHGGTIRVESTPGQGSRFEIQLPRAGAEEGTEGHSHDTGK